MRFSASLCAVALVAVPAVGQNHVAPTEPKTPAEELKSFKLPPGFAAQLVAGEPDIGKPIQIAFDARGRLWATTSRHYPFPAADGMPSDKLYVLSDFGPDGKARKVEAFADDLNIPIGILPLPDCKSCLVSEVGRVVKLTDADGDGKADQREPILTGFGSKDTHGMTNSFVLLPDGWVYACHGFANESKVTAKDGSTVTMQSGNTYRFRPDGSRVEPWTFGQVNPFGMTADPWLNLYTADCHSKPITQLIRGAYYDSFGKPHDGLGYGPHATRHDHGSTALCGLAWYAADHFPKEWNGCMFLGNAVTNRINADRIEWKGSTPVAKELPDFLVSSDPWFRPTDIKLGPDGALYVADFYNRIIGHYEVDLKHPGRDRDRGRVWRIVYTGEGGGGKAEGPKMPFKDLVAEGNHILGRILAGHPNLAVRSLATLEMLRRKDGYALTAGSGPAPNEGMLGAMLWHMDAVAPQLSLRFTGPSPGHKWMIATLRVLGARTDWDDGKRVAALGVLTPDPIIEDQFYRWSLVRAAVDALIAHPHPDNVGPLVKLLQACPAEDTHLRHAARIALRNALAATIPDPVGRGQWGYLYEHPARAAEDRILADAVLGIPTKDAAWHLGRHLYFGKPDPARVPDIAYHIGRYGGGFDWYAADWIAETRRGNLPAAVAAARQLVAGAQAGGRKLTPISYNAMSAFTARAVADPAAPAAALKLAGELAKVESAKAEIATVGLRPSNAAATPEFTSLLDAALSVSRPVDARITAIDELVKLQPIRAFDSLAKVASDPATPAAVREKALVGMAASSDPKHLAATVEVLRNAPTPLAAALAAGLASHTAGGEELLFAVRAGKASPRLLQDRALLEKLRAARVPDLDSRVAELTKGLPSADARLAELLKARAAGFANAKPDLAQGKRVFAQHCAACHQIGGDGAKIGPQLDGIGNRGADRLLEDVLDPSRNVDAAFHSRIIEMKDGRTITGLSRGMEGTVWVLSDSAGKELRIPLDVVEAQRQSPLSPMPANFDAAIPEVEFYHLLAYLLDQRAK